MQIVYQVDFNKKKTTIVDIFATISPIMLFFYFLAWVAELLAEWTLKQSDAGSIPG